MSTLERPETLRQREAPLEMSPETFRALGHRTVDRIAEMLETIRTRKVTPGESVSFVRGLVGEDGLPETGGDPAALLDRAASLLIEHSLYNGHPRFFGYITSSPAPIGFLGDLLAAAVNPNCGAFELSPMATEIELQTIRWIGEMIGFPAGAGVLVSGGNMANFLGFVAARRAKAGVDVRTLGTASAAGTLCIYTSAETHTWIQKAADLFGLGTEAIRWIPTDAHLAMDVAALREAIARDRAAGERPFIVIGTAGSVSTGAVDPLPEIAEVCRENDLWFHVDGAYGGLAAVLPDASEALRGLSLADSVAVDPHKWLYAPIEAGCTLVRDPNALRDAFSYSPAYYPFMHDAETPVNFFEQGPQNSRGFRALKVWLGLQQAGREGYVRMIGDDCRLAEALHCAAAAHPELEAFTCGLSIATFRYVPRDLRGKADAEEHLNALNQELLKRLRLGGEVFLTNAMVGGRFLLRACIVNFRTQLEDVEAVPEIVAVLGREVDRELRA
jgi:aromatic-L-amino-acid/L-tryptophan decarboxylase